MMTPSNPSGAGVSTGPVPSVGININDPSIGSGGTQMPVQHYVPTTYAPGTYSGGYSTGQLPLQQQKPVGQPTTGAAPTTIQGPGKMNPHLTVVGPPNPHIQAEQQAAAGGAAMVQKARSVLFSPWGFVRFIEFVLCIIAFCCIAGANGFGRDFVAAYLATATLFGWVYSLTLMCAYSCLPRTNLMWNFLPVTELIGDVILFTMLLTSGAVMAADCGSSFGFGPSGCDLIGKGDRDLVITSIVFTWLAWPLFTLSAWHSYKRHNQIVMANALASANPQQYMQAMNKVPAATTYVAETAHTG